MLASSILGWIWPRRDGEASLYFVPKLDFAITHRLESKSPAQRARNKLAQGKRRGNAA